MLWTFMGDLISPDPKSARLPFLWQFRQICHPLLEVAELITAEPY